MQLCNLLQCAGIAKKVILRGLANQTLTCNTNLKCIQGLKGLHESLSSSIQILTPALYKILKLVKIFKEVKDTKTLANPHFSNEKEAK